MSDKKRKVALTMMISVFVLLMILTVSYAFIRLDVANIQAEPETINVTTLKKMSLVYKDCNSANAICDAIDGSLSIGETIEKEFNIANENDGDIKYSLYFEEVVNSFKNEELVYRLENADTNEVLVEDTPLPNVAVNEKIIDEIVAKKNSNTNFKLIFTFLSKDYSQNANIEASFYAKIGFLEVKEAKSIQGKVLLHSNDNAIYKMEDDYGTSYLYRGDVSNNYFSFNNNIYRLVRINGDGSLRLVYDGTTSHENSDTSMDRLALEDVEWDASNTGFVYGNATSSNVKNVLENWYKNNITDDSMLEDSIFCGSNSESIPALVTTLKCANKENAYTVNDDYNGNALLNYPVGMLSMEEVIAVGGSTSSNQNYYLNKGNKYWTMTSSNTNKVAVGASGELISEPVTSKIGVVPVINIKAEYGMKLTGSGTVNDPYTITL